MTLGPEFKGTVALVRSGLRRDRVVLPIAFAGLLVWAVLYPIQYEAYFPTDESIRNYALTIQSNPAFEAFFGPGSALESFDGLVSWEMGPILSIVAALFGMFMLTRHTRSEEEDGRTELLLAQPVGRLAPLASATAITISSLAALSVLWWVGLVAFGMSPKGTAIQVVVIFGCGAVFTGVTAVVAQVIGHARSVRGITGALIGAAYVLRAIGDLTDSPISWLSPLQWSIASQPYGDPRLWALALPLVAAPVFLLIAFSFAGRRDYGAGMLRPKPGKASLDSRLPPPLALAFRVQRGSLIGWALGLSVAALLYGAIATEIESLLADNPQFTEALFSGGDLLDSYFATMLDFYAIVASGFVIAAALRPAAEERTGRAELPLSASRNRVAWAASHAVVAASGALLLMVLTGALSGIGYGLAGGGWDRVLELALAGPLFVPAMLVLGGLAVLGFGISNRAGNVAWAFYGLCAVLLTLESMTVVVGRLAEISPFTHLPLVPADPVAIEPLVWLTAIAATLTIAGLTLWRRRDLT